MLNNVLLTKGWLSFEKSKLYRYRTLLKWFTNPNN